MGTDATRDRSPAPNERVSRWAAPRVDLDTENLQRFLDYARRKADSGVVRLFERLAAMRPTYRLARNLSEVLRMMARGPKPMTDVLREGLSVVENGALAQLEHDGIPAELLGVAHGLLNIRDRQRLVLRFGDTFFQARIQQSAVLEISDDDS